MKKKTWMAVAGICIACAVSASEDHYQNPGNFNTLVPGYFADPTVKQFGDTFYMYATTDGTNVGRAPASVWISKDFVNWTYDTLNWPTTHFVWAPEVVFNQADGKYYYYYSQPCMVFGGVAETPLGPFRPLVGEDGLVVENYLVDSIMTLDGQILKEDDGSMYMFWGTWGGFPNHGAGIGKLNPDMKSFSELRAVRNTDVREFFEAPEPVKHEGVYYLTYSSGSCHDHTYRVQYAVSTEGVFGPYVFADNNPILSTSEDRTVHGPGHHCVLKVGDTYYIVYHRHDLPVTAGGMFRQLAADIMAFGPGNTIKKVVPTHAGIGYLAESTNPFPNLALGAKVTASSVNRDDYRPEFAVDDNNATQWRPATTTLPAWLEVDLGAVQPVRRTHTSFEYAHWFYQYRIEYSLDGEAWQVFADKGDNTRYGSPMVDYGDVEARYLRLTITGVEHQGMMPSVWNFKAFSGAKEDPPQQLVHLEAADLPAGETRAWANHRGMIGGAFAAPAGMPVAELDGRQAVVFSGGPGLASGFRFPDSENGYTVLVRVYPRGTDGYVLAAGDRGLPGDLLETGRWQYVALTVNEDEAVLYIDNERRDVPGLTGGRPAPGSVIHLGEGFTGGVAEVRVFNRELHPAEMAFFRDDTPQVPQGPAETETHGLVVHLDAMEETLGSMAAEWENRAPFGGTFANRGRTRIGVVGGRQAMVFDGRSSLQSNFNAPRSLSGNGAYSVAVWAYNPEIGEEEALVAWSRRGGPDSSAATLGFGSHGGWGAMAHWGWSDTAWGAHLPPAGQWTHIAATFDGTFVTLYVDGEPVSEKRTTLFLHPDQPVVIGASQDGHAPFNGAISSVRLYDTVLDQAAIKELAAEKPAMEVGFNIEAWTLPYGEIQSVPNPGTLGGSLVLQGPGADVKDMAGKIAIVLREGTVLGLDLPPGADPLATGSGTMIAVVYHREKGVWQMLAYTISETGMRFYLAGQPATAEEIVDMNESIEAVASMIMLDKALPAEELRAWKTALDRAGPSPDPASFETAPVAVTPGTVFMAASAPDGDAGVVEYYFRETSGNPGGSDSGWLAVNRYLNTGLQPDTTYTYTVTVRDAFGNVTQPAEPVTVVTDTALFEVMEDPFEGERDFLAAGTGGTLWTGFKGQGENESVETLAVRNGVLRIASQDTNWAFDTPRGPFLYTELEGDFVAEVELADAPGLSRRGGYGNNETGLMVRVADSDQPGSQERHLSLSFFPAWGCGNLWTNRIGGHRAQGNNGTHINADRHFQIQKLGSLPFVRTSRDGQTWTDMKESPFTRTDMEGTTLQIGLYHATYGDMLGFGEFDTFRIVRRKP